MPVDNPHKLCSIEVTSGTNGDIHRLLLAAEDLRMPGWWTYEAWQDGRLLYVGETSRGLARPQDHSLDAYGVLKQWPLLVNRWLLRQFETEIEMHADEAWRIHRMQPIYNQLHALYKVEGRKVPGCPLCHGVTERAVGKPPWWDGGDNT
jgi:hypothetical protein